ncbi:MAG: PAS-domain containing protein [Paracoccaceae bacterium]|nr:PAS-domain containing protein [Paracoccaceae bacterium]
MTSAHIIMIVMSSSLSALMAVFGLSMALFSYRKAQPVAPAAPCVFLFDRGELVDATDGARALLAATGIEADDWVRFLAYVRPRFPDFEEKLAGLSAIGRITLASVTRRPVTLRAEWHGGMTRIVVTEPGSEAGTTIVDGISQQAADEEIRFLRQTIDRAPVPAWREDANGAIVWANRTYLDLLAASGKDHGRPVWPIAPLFDIFTGGDVEAQGPECRLSLSMPDDMPTRWFDLQGFPDGGGRLNFAIPSDATVRAEAALRGFLQTLTKTFAQLNVGLAVFDRARQLVVFNPALSELTGISPEFLTSRPSLVRVLDAMRERQTLPEPKDYKRWRAQVAAVEAAALRGQYEETWALGNGQTYRVTGRPHPDGAIAFLFEDITAEKSMTQRFRADLDLGHAVIDSLDEAIAVFSPTGAVLMCNAAYDALWAGDADAPRDTTITEAIRSWQRKVSLSPVLGEARAFVMDVGPKEAWRGEIRLTDGRLMACRFTPLAGGWSLIGFSPLPPGLRPAQRAATTARQTA